MVFQTDGRMGGKPRTPSPFLGQVMAFMMVLGRSQLGGELPWGSAASQIFHSSKALLMSVMEKGFLQGRITPGFSKEGWERFSVPEMTIPANEEGKSLINPSLPLSGLENTSCDVKLVGGENDLLTVMVTFNPRNPHGTSTHHTPPSNSTLWVRI